ncbi:MAG: PAS domain-containing protein [Candidatus Competibacteraceae bacterium]
MESTSDWIWEVDQNGRYTYTSPRVLDILGYTPAEVLGKTPFDFMEPEEADLVSAIFADIIAARRPFNLVENTCLHKDGYLVILETSGMPCFDVDGQFAGYHGIDRDITARKAIEQALHSSEQRYFQATTTLRDAFIILDDTGQVIEWNPAAETLFGYRRDEMLGRNVHEALAPERYHDAYRQAWPRFRETGQGAAISKTLELVALHRDGHEFPIELSLSAYQREGAWQAVGLVRDIAERKKTNADCTLRPDGTPNWFSNVASPPKSSKKRISCNTAKSWPRVSRTARSPSFISSMTMNYRPSNSSPGRARHPGQAMHRRLRPALPRLLPVSGLMR